jgi:hypothetical protein
LKNDQVSPPQPPHWIHNNFNDITVVSFTLKTSPAVDGLQTGFWRARRSSGRRPQDVADFLEIPQNSTLATAKKALISIPAHRIVRQLFA